MSSSLAKRNPALQAKIEQMALPLIPLVRITTGEVSAAFPSTVLNFWLLTSDQLDDLAHFYHQRTPSKFTRYYPCPVEWGPNLTLEDKRRKIGRFIGLQGCETPVKIKSQDEIMEEARQARLEEEQELMRKARWY